MSKWDINLHFKTCRKKPSLHHNIYNKIRQEIKAVTKTFEAYVYTKYSQKYLKLRPKATIVTFNLYLVKELYV